MKKIINILIALCVWSITFAQNKFGIKNPESKIEIDTTTKFRNNLFNIGRVVFGIKAGFTYSNIYGSDITYIFADGKTNYQSAFHIGISVDSKLREYFWLKHELLFNQNGAGVLLSDSINGTYSSQLKTYYLQLFPISPTFHIKGFQLYVGPYISTLLDAKIQRKNASGEFYNDHSIFGDASQFENKSKYLQKFDFGIAAGIEYQFPFGLSIGAKYTHGFTEIFQYANSYTLNDTKREIKIYNQGIQFSLGYSFNGKRR